MKVGDRHFRSIWLAEDGKTVEIIDQRWLPHQFKIEPLTTLEAAAIAIKDMWVRGAPLIGATAGYGVAIEMLRDPSDASLDNAWNVLHETRPTAINLRWALDDMKRVLAPLPPSERAAAAYKRAAEICDEDVAINRAIGENGLKIIREIAARKKPGERVNILTHCNAGWPATVDYGTATAPIYLAVEAGIPVHVYVDETRPRNQGAHLTSWELSGPRRAAHIDRRQCWRPFHAARPWSTWSLSAPTAPRPTATCATRSGPISRRSPPRIMACPSMSPCRRRPSTGPCMDGVKEIPIEERTGDEVSYVWGRNEAGTVERVRISPDATPAANPAFDVTPARLVTGLITERGISEASPEGLLSLRTQILERFPEKWTPVIRPEPPQNRDLGA